MPVRKGFFKPQRAQKTQRGTNSLEALIESDEISLFYLCPFVSFVLFVV